MTESANFPALKPSSVSRRTNANAPHNKPPAPGLPGSLPAPNQDSRVRLSPLIESRPCAWAIIGAFGSAAAAMTALPVAELSSAETSSIDRSGAVGEAASPALAPGSAGPTVETGSPGVSAAADAGGLRRDGSSGTVSAALTGSLFRGCRAGLSTIGTSRDDPRADSGGSSVGSSRSSPVALETPPRTPPDGARGAVARVPARGPRTVLLEGTDDDSVDVPLDPGEPVLSA